MVISSHVGQKRHIFFSLKDLRFWPISLNFAVIDPFILVFLSTDGSMIVCSSMDVRAQKQKTAVSCNVSGVPWADL